MAGKAVIVKMGCVRKLDVAEASEGEEQRRFFDGLTQLRGIAVQWIKKAYDAVGLTQHPVGKNLAVLQNRLGGSVVLCLDVSGSMYGDNLLQAKKGCRRFVTEAISAGYSIAGLLWHHGIAGNSELGRDRQAVDLLFAEACANGGNNIVPALQMSEQILASATGDCVIAIFGDGDLGDPENARREAARLAAHGIRVITCGLGDASAEELNAISTELDQVARVAQQGNIADAIADMARGLRRR